MVLSNAERQRKFRENSVTVQLSPELKKAARMLSNTTFNEPNVKLGFGHHPVHLSSTNDAIAYLVKKGMKYTLGLIDQQISRDKESLEIWEPMVAFLLQDPAADSIEASNFTEGSPAWDHLMQLESEGQTGILRADAMRMLADTQESLSSLMRAKEAIEEANVA